MKEEQLTSIEIPIIKDQKLNLPPLKNNPEENLLKNEKIIKDLPSWNIEPPLEIKRGQ